MKVIAIANPVAGASLQLPKLRLLMARLRAAGYPVEQIWTRAPGQAMTIATRIAREVTAKASLPGRSGPNLNGDGRCIIAAGGDGTLREVAQGLAGSPVPMIAWPTGTENLLAKSFGFKADPDVALSCVTQGRTRTMDIGMANGHAFLTVAGVGFDAEVVERLVRIRNGHITHLTYAIPMWRTFWEHRFPPCRVLSDGNLLWQGRGMVFVGNLPRYSLGLRVIRDAEGDDGLLDVCIMPCRTRWELVCHSLRTVFRRHIEHGGVRYFRVRQVRIESDETVPVELDGEAAGHLPIDIRVQPRALHLQTPPA